MESSDLDETHGNPGGRVKGVGGVLRSSFGALISGGMGHRLLDGLIHPAHPATKRVRPRASAYLSGVLPGFGLQGSIPGFRFHSGCPLPRLPQTDGGEEEGEDRPPDCE